MAAEITIAKLLEVKEHLDDQQDDTFYKCVICGNGYLVLGPKEGCIICDVCKGKDNEQIDVKDILEARADIKCDPEFAKMGCLACPQKDNCKPSIEQELEAGLVEAGGKSCDAWYIRGEDGQPAKGPCTRIFLPMAKYREICNIHKSDLVTFGENGDWVKFHDIPVHGILNLDKIKYCSCGD